MHPNLSIHNGRINFNKNFYDSELDIWSLGIVLYYLIYKVSPFRKEGREVFSKTILR
jgi:serine/threonine protein kinase